MRSLRGTLTHAFVACLLVLCIASCVVPAAAQSNSSNYMRTLRFLQGFTDTIPQLKTNWTGTNFYVWDGIRCDGRFCNDTISIDLAEWDVVGTTPDAPNGDGEILVTSIDLSNNHRLRGGFRESWAGLTRLTMIDLSNTSMLGQIPHAWKEITLLEYVYISSTGACYSMPNWGYDDLPMLREVDFSHNNIKKLSPEFGSFSTEVSPLTSLNLEGNKFCFCLPSTWTSGLLRNAALTATPALNDTNCNVTNRCTNNDINRCSINGAGLTFSSWPLALLAALAAALLAL